MVHIRRCALIFAVWSRFLAEYKIVGAGDYGYTIFVDQVFGFDWARHRGCREMIE